MNKPTLRSTSLVLCPGLLCDGAMWRDQVAALSGVIDVGVATYEACSSIEAMADEVLALAPPTFALAGLSMGGYVAQEVMRRGADRVERLALLDTSARPDSPEQSTRRRDLIKLSSEGQFRGVTPRLLPLLVHPLRLDDQELCIEIQQMAERVGQDVFLRHQTAIMNRKDGRPDLTDIDVPTLVLCGRQDALTPLDAHIEMADVIPGADLVVLGDCGHMSTMERPDAVTAALKSWLGLS